MKAFIATGFLLLAGCVEEPTAKEAEAAAEAMGEADSQNVVKERQLSIEQAAEEAVELIEAEAKEEADAANAEANAEQPD